LSVSFDLLSSLEESLHFSNTYKIILDVGKKYFDINCETAFEAKNKNKKYNQ
jgi:hypothetical protein